MSRKNSGITTHCTGRHSHHRGLRLVKVRVFGEASRSFRVAPVSLIDMRMKRPCH